MQLIFHLVSNSLPKYNGNVTLDHRNCGVRVRHANKSSTKYFNPNMLTIDSCHHIGIGRFRILRGPRFRILGGKGGPNSQQAHDVVTTSMRRNDVASTSFRRRVPIRFLINQCQIITFLILKYDIIENSRIELRGIILPVQMGGLLGGQRVCWPHLSNYWRACPPPPPHPSSYAYASCMVHS